LVLLGDVAAATARGGLRAAAGAEPVADGVQRTETTGDQVDLKTPSIIQRLDLSPRLTFPFTK